MNNIKTKKIILAAIMLVVILFFVAYVFIGRPYSVPTSSMKPTIPPGSVVFINKIKKNIRMGDIIAIQSKKTNGGIWIRRVLGVRHSRIYWNQKGVYLPNKYEQLNSIPRIKSSRDDSDNKIYLGRDEYFLGADSANGIDSRMLGAFSNEDIVGKVTCYF